MTTINASGMVLTTEQVREDRRRRGYCESCRGIEPNKCFEIKKRMGGMYRDRIPLTIAGKVRDGVCLDCHPAKAVAEKQKSRLWRWKAPKSATTDDAQAVAALQHPHLHGPPRHEREQGMAADGAEGHYGNDRVGHQGQYGNERGDYQEDQRRQTTRSMSLPSIPYKRAPTRQVASRRLEVDDESFDARNQYAASMPPMHHDGREADDIQFLEQEDDRRQRQLDEAEQALREDEYVQEIQYNIFNEPVIVRKKKSRSFCNNHNDPSPRDIMPPRQNSGRHQSPHNEDTFPPFPHHESTGRDFYGNNHRDGSPPQNFETHRQNSGRHVSPHNNPRLDDNPKMESIPSLFKNLSNNEASASAEEEEPDALAALIAAYADAHPEETGNFVPGSQIVPGAEGEIHLPAQDDVSVMTCETFFQGRESLASMVSKGSKASRPSPLSAVRGNTIGSTGSEQRSMITHQIHEPALPARVARQASVPEDETGPEPEVAASAANNVTDMESYLESFTPDLVTLREFVGQLMQQGSDDLVIDTVTEALIHDNAKSMSTDIAMFCLTQLWVLAKKDKKNKRTIIFEGSTFDAIIEAMEIYGVTSVEIQNRACTVLWSLSIDPADRKHVAQGGGCDAILNAMRLHGNDAALQIMALGALKVLSFDDIAKSTLRSKGAQTIVSGAMQNHLDNPAVQSEGCVIIGNLAMSGPSFVAPVGEREIAALINGILNNPDSLEVHEAACFAMMSLASLASNVAMIQKNSNTRVALEMACGKHPKEVGSDVLTLLSRLNFAKPDASSG